MESKPRVKTSHSHFKNSLEMVASAWQQKQVHPIFNFGLLASTLQNSNQTYSLYQHSANISIKINTEEFNTELIQECDRNDLGHARQGLDEKRSGIGMVNSFITVHGDAVDIDIVHQAFARKISSSSTTTFADSPVIQPV